MAKLQSSIKIGLSVGQDPHCDKFPRLGRKGYDIVETGPVNDDKLHDFIARTASRKKNYLLAANLNSSSSPMNEEDAIKMLERNFCLFYDFVDLIVIDITSRNADYSVEIFESFTKTRISYEEYRPILVRVSSNLDEESANIVLSNCRLYGLDGIISEDWRRMYALTSGRFPIYAEIRASNIEMAYTAINEGIPNIMIRGNRLTRRALRQLKSIE